MEKNKPATKLYHGFKKLVALDNGKYIISSLAFYLFISLLPLLTVFVMILAAFNVPEEYIVNLLEIFLPTNLEYIDQVIDHLKHFSGVSVFSLGFSFFIAIYMASRGIEIIVNFADSVYGYTEIHQKTIKKKIRSMIFTFTVLISLGAIISIYLNLEIWTRQFLDSSLILWFRIPILFIMFVFLLMAIMIFTPRKRQTIFSTYQGVLFAAISLTIMVTVFMWYITNINDYSTIYGPISAIIILLLLFYFSSYLLLIGIYINAIKSRKEKIFN